MKKMYISSLQYVRLSNYKPPLRVVSAHADWEVHGNGFFSGVSPGNRIVTCLSVVVGLVLLINQSMQR